MVFGCILENTVENTFFYLLLTFSQLPNKYIISFINRSAVEIEKQNPTEKIHQQINTKETKPNKKNSSNPAVKGKRDRSTVENDGENGGVDELWVENEIGFRWIGLGW